MRSISPLIALAFCASPCLAQSLLVPESTNDRVMEFSAFDGSLLNPAFIDLTLGTGTPPATPLELIEVNGEFWITDQFADVIHRWSSDGATYLGEVGAGRDNMRGLALASNGSVYVTNSGTQGAGYDDVVKEYLSNGTFIAANVAFDPYDVIDTGSELLYTDIENEAVQRMAYDGTALGQFSDPASLINFPEQITRKVNGNYLVAGFTTPGGIYEFDGTTGAEVQFIDTTALGFPFLRAVFELGNGNLFFTNTVGAHIYDVSSGTVSTVVPSTSARFITLVGSSDAVSLFCEPANPNSTGVPVTLTASGSFDSASSSPVHLEATGGRPNFGAYFLVSTGASGNTVISDGIICLDSPQGRYNPSAGGNLNSLGFFDASGVLQNASGTSTVGSGYDVPGNLPNPPGGTILSGSTWYFQLWYRDLNPGTTSNFSNGLAITFN